LPDPGFQSLGSPFVELQSVDSTNNYALARIHAGLAQHGAAFFAHDQFAGKGQRGKTWVAEKGNNLILSVVINPQPLGIAHQFQLSACVAVSVYELFKKYTRDEATRIKWPNDLYWQDRKAGGILIENIIGKSPMADGGWQMTDPPSAIHHPSSEWQWAVAGIGININQASFPAGLKKPVSLRQITGKKFNTPDMARELCLIMDRNLTRLHKDGFKDIYRSYLDHLYKRNETVRFKKGSRRFDAIVKNVSESGKLVVQHALEEEFMMGELEWL
jgi:BirA family biotin operon repressor/biotin-[acetyl-CoA-carboxylase] ligase